MESLSKHSAITQRSLRYLVACLLASSVLACSSDDDKDNKSSSAEKSSDSADTAKAGSSGKKGDAGTVEPFHPTASPEQEASSKEQMRYDGEWTGTTSQDKPVTFKVLSRFLGHIEVTYKLEGDGCKADDKTAKVSAMVGIYNNAFTIMNTNSTEQLMAKASFTGDNDSNGTFSVTPVGDLPAGCNATVSGTWKATK